MTVATVQDEREKNETYELSSLQQGMIFHQLSREGDPADLLQFTFTLREELGVVLFREAWNRVVARHPSLRASFHWKGDGDPIQVVHEDVDVPFRYRDWRDMSDARREEGMEACLQAHRREGFDLEIPPAMRLALFRMEPSEYRLVWTCHHIIADGRSARIVIEDVFEIYEELRKGREPSLGSPPPYTDYLRWLKKRDREGEREFWTERLAGFEASTPLPYDRGEPGEAAGEDDPGWHAVERRLPASTTSALRRLTREHDFTLSTVIQATWALLLSRFSGEEDVVFGTARAGRPRELEGAEEMVGLFTTAAPMRVRVEPHQRLVPWLERLRRAELETRPHQRSSMVDIQRWSDVPPGSPVIESVVVYDRETLDSDFRSRAGRWMRREIGLRESTGGYPLSFYAYGDSEMLLRIVHDPERVDAGGAKRVLDAVTVLLESIAEDPRRELSELAILDEAERDRLDAWNRTETPLPEDARVHDLFEEQVRRTPEETAVVDDSGEVTYRELDRRADRLAARLRGMGVGPGTLVGISLGRSADMVAALFAVLKAGGAYVPLDPDYPDERIDYVLEDADVEVLLTERTYADRFSGADARVVVLDEAGGEAADGGDAGAHGGDADGTAEAVDGETAGDAPAASPDDLAYVIYTSGSTGRPKGVMVEHRNVVNFVTAMDDVVRADDDGTWLAVTSLSFDISVLELIWTLSRGFEVVLYDRDELRPGASPDPVETSRARADDDGTAAADGDGAADGTAAATASDAAEASAPSAGDDEAGSADETPDDPADLDLSLFYFSAQEGDGADGDSYRLLMDGARFADREGFRAVWTPERHFHEFGGLYPNPALTSAAVAAVTERVEIRAGSVVLPLHDPIRVAEEWSLVDRLSDGRVGVSFASGWQPNDFVLAPDRYEDRKAWTYGEIETVRALWRGESVTRPGPDGEPVELETLPRPVQSELPTWLTTSGSPATFRKAGEMGVNVLTHLLGQDVEELAGKIEDYRETREAHGHDPDEGRVALMLHTFVGDDRERVREIVRGPMKSYLRSATGLIRSFADEWFSARSGGDGGDADAGGSLESLSEQEMDSLLEFAFERYFSGNGLFGTREDCLETLRELRASGVDEVACLIDFGVDEDVVLEHLETLADVKDRFGHETGDAPATAAGTAGDGAAAAGEQAAPAGGSRFAEQIRDRQVTHLQTTPSMARLLLQDPGAREALGSLRQILLGGEVLPPDLVRDLRRHTDAEIVNMYGPTETTVWSAAHPVHEVEEPLPIGRPLANTRVHVLDRDRRRLPVGAVGELYIGGDGVTRGYLGRPELTNDSFVPDPFSEDEDACLYRTGDLARWRPDGRLEFLGRTDHQVQIRGHRVELGEIEAALERRPEVEAAAVVFRGGDDAAGDAAAGDAADARLVAYAVASEDADPPSDGRLRAALRRSLPEHMVPNVFVWLGTLPLTASGKLDRNALPAPAEIRGEAAEDGTAGSATAAAPDGSAAGVAVAEDTAAAPEAPSDTPAETAAGGEDGTAAPRPSGDELEETIVGIWSDVLGQSDVGVEDNFFDLGGHSLMAVKVHARLKEVVGADLAITDLFRHPTVRSLARHLGHDGDAQNGAGQKGRDRARKRRRTRGRRRREKR